MVVRSVGSLVAGAVLSATSSEALEIPLYAVETAGYERRSEPVSCGLPLPRGGVSDLSQLGVSGPDGAAVPAQLEALSRWPDGSRPNSRRPPLSY